LESIQLDSNGNSKICDFKTCIDYKERSKSGNVYKNGTTNDTFKVLKDLEYRTPENVDFNKSMGFIEHSSDFWALGISMFKMLSGFFPFLSKQSIINDEVPDLQRPETSKEAKEFIKILLEKNQFKRIGSRKKPINVKSIPFFKDINWDSLEKGEVEPPFKQISLVKKYFINYFLHKNII